MPELSNRLKMAAEYVRQGSVIADIGTDHAYLPAFLLTNNIATKALACDLRKGPLFNAEKTIKEFHLENRTELRLSDGLENVKPGEADDIIICGMGGTLIVEILEKAEWLKDKRYRLILQPQSHSEDVRKYLTDNCFDIVAEPVCRDAGRVYNGIIAEYSGIKRDYPSYFIYFGNLISGKDEISRKLTEKSMKLLKVRQEAEEKFRSEAEAARLKKIIDEAEAYINENK